MLIGLLAIVMTFGGTAAATALISGWSLPAALLLYSGAGLFSVLAMMLLCTVLSARRRRKGDIARTNPIAGN